MVLAKSCIFAQSADVEQRQHSFGGMIPSPIFTLLLAVVGLYQSIAGG